MPLLKAYKLLRERYSYSKLENAPDTPFVRVQREVLDVYCARCHGRQNRPPAGFRIDFYDFEGNERRFLTEQLSWFRNIATPRNLSRSQIYQVIATDRMPRTKDGFDKEKALRLISDWLMSLP